MRYDTRVRQFLHQGFRNFHEALRRASTRPHDVILSLSKYVVGPAQHDVVSFSHILFLVIFFFSLSLAYAQPPSFPDIPLEAWYREEVESFLAQGYLDGSQPKFRGSERATRAEFVKLIVELSGGILDDPPEIPSFDDVAANDWFFPYFEEGVREKWVKGDQDCLGNAATEGRAVSCVVRPHAPILRAEAAVLLSRAFGMKPLSRAPGFSDNPPGSWFSDHVQAAADHCILRGDDNTRSVRPEAYLNRAEMVVMLSRVDEGRKYPEC